MPARFPRLPAIPPILVLAACAATGTAGAADLPARGAAPAYAVAVPAFSWTGFYAGANIGYGTRIGEDDTLAVQPGFFPTAPATAGTLRSERKGSGLVGGAQVGYDYQIGNWVLGIENDIQYIDLGKRRPSYTFSGVGGVPADFAYVGPESTTDWFASGRARVGYAFDRLLVYGTGGLTYANLKSGYCARGDCEKGRIGYAGGAGIEYAVTPKLSLRAEGLYVNLGQTSSGAIGTDAAGRVYVGSSRKVDNEAVIGRLGLNYRF